MRVTSVRSRARACGGSGVMLGTGRAPRSRMGKHLAGALAASLVGASVAMVFAGDPVGAAGHPHARTVTVTFTDSGPSPSSVQLGSGDSVRFVNKLSQTGQVPIGGGLTAQVRSAGVTVHGVAVADVDLPEFADSRKLTYPGPQTVDYTATYTLSLDPVLDVLGVNLAPDTVTTTTAGRLEVAAATDPPPPGSGHHAGGQPPGQGGGDGAAGQPDRTGDGGNGAGQGGTGGPLHQAPGVGAAAQVVPPGSGGSATTGRPPPPVGGPGRAGQPGAGLPQLP